MNVEHMELVTHAENIRRGFLRKGRCLSDRHVKRRSGLCMACVKLYQKSPAFKASVKRWADAHREERRAYAREWMRRKRGRARAGEARLSSGGGE